MLCILYAIADTGVFGVAGVLFERLLPSAWARRWMWCIIMPLPLGYVGYSRLHHAISVGEMFRDTPPIALDDCIWARIYSLGGMGSLEQRLTVLLSPAPLRFAQRVMLAAVACALLFAVPATPHPVIDKSHLRVRAKSLDMEVHDLQGLTNAAATRPIRRYPAAPLSSYTLRSDGDARG
ncbi:MAG: hypothetical protein JWM95_2721 [Gemmatimonadetes bacterium]|nr:hypothetical protein [Gemmatimonadota bacterium]